jgi:hypothetical protein
MATAQQRRRLAVRSALGDPDLLYVIFEATLQSTDLRPSDAVAISLTCRTWHTIWKAAASKFGRECDPCALRGKQDVERLVLTDYWRSVLHRQPFGLSDNAMDWRVLWSNSFTKAMFGDVWHLLAANALEFQADLLTEYVNSLAMGTIRLHDLSFRSCLPHLKELFLAVPDHNPERCWMMRAGFVDYSESQALRIRDARRYRASERFPREEHALARFLQSLFDEKMDHPKSARLLTDINSWNVWLTEFVHPTMVRIVLSVHLNAIRVPQNKRTKSSTVNCQRYRLNIRLCTYETECSDSTNSFGGPVSPLLVRNCLTGRTQAIAFPSKPRQSASALTSDDLEQLSTNARRFADQFFELGPPLLSSYKKPVADFIYKTPFPDQKVKPKARHPPQKVACGGRKHYQ